MKKITVLIATLAMMALGSTAMAQQLKIGVVDMPRAVMSSQAAQKASEEMRAFEAERTQRIQPLREEFSQMENDYRSQEKVLTDAAKRTRLEALQKKANELESTARQYASEIQQKNDELTSKMINDVQRIVGEVAKEEKFSMVLNVQAVAYIDNPIDITDKVVERYNRQQGR